MNILDRIRTTTVADLEGVPSHFDDLPRGHFSAKRDKGMVRIVKGADDLVYTGPRNQNPGMITISTTAQLQSTGDHPATCDNSRCCPQDGPIDRRTPGQVRYMDNLISWITEKDADLGAKARAWTDGMTGAGKWVAGRDTNVSKWIDSLKAKNAELNDAAKRTPRPATTDDYADILSGYYAVADSGPADLHYFRVSRYRSGDVKLQEQASDTLYPVYGGRIKAVLTTIRTVGIRSSMELYGQTIGRCGRCNRTLTDPESRACGIGPDCRSKM